MSWRERGSSEGGMSSFLRSGQSEVREYWSLRSMRRNAWRPSSGCSEAGMLRGAQLKERARSPSEDFQAGSRCVSWISRSEGSGPQRTSTLTPGSTINTSMRKGTFRGGGVRVRGGGGVGEGGEGRQQTVGLDWGRKMGTSREEQLEEMRARVVMRIFSSLESCHQLGVAAHILPRTSTQP